MKTIPWRAVKETMLDFPLYIISRPFKGFDEMKNLKRGDMRYVIAILIIHGLVALSSEAGMGFIITEFYEATPVVYIPYILTMAYAPIALFVIANWSVTTITDGKGSLKYILMAYAYTLFPYIICRLIGLALSNYVTLNEAAFATFFLVFATVSQYFYLFIALIIIHEYTFTKAVLTVILTIIAMLIITFVIALFISLASEVVMFALTVYQEVIAKF